eukprot:m.280988 g.280988  ORF g.280988 m.280988 type:complete len:233 (-) comp150566_c0_seq1:41-739(-)
MGGERCTQPIIPYAFTLGLVELIRNSLQTRMDTGHRWCERWSNRWGAKLIRPDAAEIGTQFQLHGTSTAAERISNCFDSTNETRNAASVVSWQLTVLAYKPTTAAKMVIVMHTEHRHRRRRKDCSYCRPPTQSHAQNYTEKQSKIQHAYQIMIETYITVLEGSVLKAFVGMAIIGFNHSVLTLQQMECVKSHLMEPQTATNIVAESSGHGGTTCHLNHFRTLISTEQWVLFR